MYVRLGRGPEGVTLQGRQDRGQRGRDPVNQVRKKAAAIFSILLGQAVHILLLKER